MQAKLRLTTVVTCAALGLVACNRNGQITTGGMGGGGDNRICTPFASTTTPTNTGMPSPTLASGSDPSAGIDDCVHRWGYALAGGRDTADMVARGVVAACGAALSGWNQQVVGQSQGPDGSGGGDAVSLTTGQPLNPIGAHMEFAQQRALFYVIQARAGHCSAPPATTTQNATTNGRTG